jgi:hypothetical protein
VRVTIRQALALILAASLLALALAACSSNGPQATPPPSPTNDDVVIGSTQNYVPGLLPTYTVPQPVELNPGPMIGTVYISDKDGYFHRPDCPRLGTPSTPIIRPGAMAQGYTACPVCNP